MFLGIALEKCRIELFANKREAFFLEVLWIGNAGLSRLFGDKFLGLFGVHIGAVKFVNSIKIDRHWIEFALVASIYSVSIVVKLGKFGDVLPDILVLGVENMRTIFVNFDASLFVGIAIDISGDMIAFLDDEYVLAATR